MKNIAKFAFCQKTAQRNAEGLWSETTALLPWSYLAVCQVGYTVRICICLISFAHWHAMSLF